MAISGRLSISNFRDHAPIDLKGRKINRAGNGLQKLKKGPGIPIGNQETSIFQGPSPDAGEGSFEDYRWGIMNQSD